MSHTGPTNKLPTVASEFVRYVLAFSVSVAIGLAPYLGRADVPLFVPMLSLIPESLQDIAVPLSTGAMGIVAVGVQWYGSRRLSTRRLQKWFVRALLTCIGALIIFAVIEMVAVVRIDVPAVGRTVSFAIGISHPSTPPCASLGRVDCITHELSLDEGRIDTYFGEFQTTLAKLVLVLSYILFMSTFGLIVGLFVLGRRADWPAKSLSGKTISTVL